MQIVFSGIPKKSPLSRRSRLEFAGAEAVQRDHRETDQRQHERQIHGGHAEQFAPVDDRRLQRGQHRPAENGHDQSRRPELRVVPESFERDAVFFIYLKFLNLKNGSILRFAACISVFGEHQMVSDLCFS